MSPAAPVMTTSALSMAFARLLAAIGQIRNSVRKK
jgi:hypothetical protein